MEAIILDGEQKSALATVRALGKRGIRVIVGATRASAMSLHSRYTTTGFVYPDPKNDRAAFVTKLKQQLRIGETPPVLYTFSDATSSTVYGARESLSSFCHYYWPAADQFEMVTNKAATYSESKLLGVPTVSTFLFANTAEIDKRTSDFSWPMVLKPRRSVSVYGAGLSAGTAQFVHTLEELKTTFRLIASATGEPPLVQPFVSGEEYGVEVVARDGQVVAGLVHHRLRSLSPTGGASVLKETMIDGELYDTMRVTAEKLVAALQWTGPLMVEYKLDPDTHTPLLMELNGRWWGSLPLALAAGSDLPYTYAEVVSGQPKITEGGWNTQEVTTNYWLGDVRHLLRVLLARDPMRSLLYPGRKLAVRDFVRTLWHVPTDVWTWRDPLPSVWQYIDILKR